MAAASLNKNNSAVKRIMQEAKELANDPSTDYAAAPLEDDIFEWHCTLRGPAGTEFEGGLYHFRILLPAEYPFRPPSLMMLTPNGRFELNTKICISFTNYHEELWQPAWGVRTAIIGLQGFFPLKGQDAVGVGSIEYPPSERKRLAALSREWVCPHCGDSNLHMLPDPPTNASSSVVAAAAAAARTPITASSALLEDTTHSQIATPETPQVEISIPQSVPQIESSSEVTPEPQPIMHNIDPLLPSSGGSAGIIQTRQAPFVTRAGVATPIADAGHVSQAARRRTPKAPLWLDTAICVLLVMVIAIICRRVT
ncbi:Ubiquitin-conjugating enzyme E2 32 [Hypsizygus marmoreus]|uniref:Ubiquitin-conjugating enzyme E2 32 n=1 Tax=Hypsizygus marmoreus TaxID=39966 RepID=A0A369K010_HYPMA|nr:Ubiquitin-conjugating enzyme E2 32 [Hypsizygus marmoreus]